jgi:hypothetical protein
LGWISVMSSFQRKLSTQLPKHQSRLLAYMRGAAPPFSFICCIIIQENAMKSEKMGDISENKSIYFTPTSGHTCKTVISATIVKKFSRTTEHIWSRYIISVIQHQLIKVTVTNLRIKYVSFFMANQTKRACTSFASPHTYKHWYLLRFWTHFLGRQKLHLLQVHYKSYSASSDKDNCNKFDNKERKSFSRPNKEICACTRIHQLEAYDLNND